MYLFNFLTVLALHCCTGFSLVLESGGYLLVVVQRLLTEAGSLDSEHRL